MNYLRKNEKGGVLIFELVLLVIVLAAAGYAGYVYYQNKNKVNTPTTPIVHRPPTPSATPDPYAGWKTYTSKTEGLTFKYPPTWTFDSTGASDPSDDGGTFKAPSGGLEVDWSSSVSGLGGACDKNVDPHYYFYQITQLPLVPSDYLVEFGRGSITQMAIINTKYYNYAPLKVGDTGQCIFYGLFKSTDGARDMLLQGQDLLNGSKALSSDQIAQLRQILLSVQY